jgi:ribosomal-protein-alanine N-acetyltransferase
MLLNTARCTLRELKIEDRSLIVALSTDKEARRFLGGPVSIEQAHRRADQLIAGVGVKHCWAVELIEDAYGRAVGLIHISLHHDGEEDELSYEFLPRTWGKGIASEAVKAATQHALTRLGYSRLIAETQAGNVRSRQLLERLGLKPVKTLLRFGQAQVLYATIPANQ